MAAVELTTTTTSPHDHGHDREEEEDKHAVATAGDDGVENTLRIADSDVLRTRRKFTHTSDPQRRSVIEWLEEARNFQLLTGTGGAVPLTNDVGKKLKKTDGFRSLMRHVNARTNAQWTIDVTRSRYESLMAAFRKTQRLAERGDVQVSEGGKAKGVVNARQKLNGTCRFYDRLDALFKTGKPLATAAAGGGVVGAAAGEGGLEAFAVKRGDNVVVEGSVADAIALAVAVTQVNLSNGSKREAENSDVADGNAAKHVERVALEAAGDASFTSPRRSPSPNAKRLKTRHHQSSPATPAVEDKSTSSVAVEPPIVAAADRDSTVAEQEVKPSAMSSDDAMASKALDVEKQRITLQQEQVAIQRRELELKEKELVSEESMRKQAVRAELTTKLVLAGKSLAEVKEFLALLG
ncbi:hypothetical protein Gpo141_00014417 [Globisporangium polare]